MIIIHLDYLHKMTSVSFRCKPEQKFRNVKTTIDGLMFDSKREASRYAELKLLERVGDIEKLELQPKFPLLVNGLKICTYIADFSYTDRRTGERVVEDVKSAPTKTAQYRIKVKLLKALHGIKVLETS